MKRNHWMIALVFLLVATLACSVFSGGGPAPATESAPEAGGGTEPTEAPASGDLPEPTAAPEVEKAPDSYDTEFPLPAEVSNFMNTGNGGINFQTKMSLTDAIAFYRDEFSKAGYTERQITTAISDTTFSMVFDGHSSGKAVVIQGVDLGSGNTNLNIRFEDV